MSLWRASAGGVEGTRFSHEPAPGGATAGSRLVAQGRTSPLRHCGGISSYRLSAAEGKSCALWWTRFCERDFGLPEASPNGKYRPPGFELCPKGVFVDL